MPQMGQYRVKLLDWTATPIMDLFPGDDFLSISWEHKRNQPGAFACELVGETATHERFVKHYQVLIERNWGNEPGDWYEEFSGFFLGYTERWPTDTVDKHFWTALGLSPEWLADQPLLQPVANTGNSQFAFYDLWWNHGAADDTAKLMFAESAVSPATVIIDSTTIDRTFTNVTVEGDEGEGVWSCYEGSWVRCLDAIVDSIGEDGTKGNCDFRIERVSGGYQFNTYSPYFGTDRRRGNDAGNKPTIFSFDNGNMKNPERQVLWADAVTAAYGGWQGGEMQRTIYYQENATALAETPYARREGFYDVREVPQGDTVDGILQQKLIDDGEKELVSAEILQTDACLYGRDWWYGDLVTLDLPDGSTYDMRVIEVRGRISGDNEEEIEGVIELWDRAESA